MGDLVRDLVVRMRDFPEAALQAVEEAKIARWIVRRETTTLVALNGDTPTTQNWAGPATGWGSPSSSASATGLASNSEKTLQDSRRILGSMAIVFGEYPGIVRDVQAYVCLLPRADPLCGYPTSVL